MTYISTSVQPPRRSAAAPPLDGLRELIANRLADKRYEAAHSFLGQLLDDVSAWEADFVKAARHHALAVYKPQLLAAHDLWNRTEKKYGLGLDYREEVANELEKWFDQHDDLHDRLEQQIRRAWRASVLDPLRNASGNVDHSKAAAE